MKYLNRYIFFLLTILFFQNSSGQISHFYSMTNSSLARPVAMGGAFTAVQDGPASTIYNPATLVHWKYPQTSGFSLWLSPVGVAGLIHSRDRLHQAVDPRGYHWAGGLGLLVKSVVYSRQAFVIGLNLSEQLPLNPMLAGSNDPLATDGILDWNYDVLTVNLKLAEQIAIGASGFYVKNFEDGETRHSYATSYGIFMRPSAKFSVGVSFFDYPERIAPILAHKIRAVDESINVGVTYRPFTPLMLSLDLRNVSEDGQLDQEGYRDGNRIDVSNELHLGAELQVKSAGAIRAGFYRLNDLGQNIYSVGIALLDANIFRNLDRQLIYRDYVLNYGLQFDQTANTNHFVHTLTFLVRL